MPIKNHRLDDAEWAPTPHLFGAIDPTLCVIHETGTRIAEGKAVAYCRAPRSTNPVRVGYHVVIERSGKKVQLAAFNQKVRHAGISSWKGRKWCNGFSVGIGLVGPTELKGTAKRARAFYGKRVKGVFFPKWFTADDGIIAADSPHHGKGHVWLPHTEAQLKALDEVVADLREAYPGIDIAGHYHVSPGRKIDPSPLVDIDSLGAAPSTPSKLETPSQDFVVAKAECSDQTLSKQSREYKSVKILKNSAGLGAIGLSLHEAASQASISSAKAYLDLVNSFTTAYGVPFLIVTCLGIYAIGELIAYWKRESFDAGLYEPSGADAEAS